MKLHLRIFLLAACVSWNSTALSHTIQTKDGRTISSPEVWEEVQGYYIDDVSLYAYKTAGMPAILVNKLADIQFQMIRSKDALLQRISSAIGAANFQKFRPTIEKYIEEKVVISYEKGGNTLSLDKEEVENIVYDTPPPPLKIHVIDANDAETRQAIAAEEARLYEKLREARETKNALPAGDPEKRKYEASAQKIQGKINDLKRNPIGYFLRYYPASVTLSAPMTPEECAELCGGAPSKGENKPTIAATSEEAMLYKRCVARCANPQQVPPQKEEHDHDEAEEPNETPR